MKGYERRMRRLLAGAVCVPLRPEHSYVLMSDCHRGDGNWNDNFANNKTIYLAALREYYDRGFIYLELGDGDELWENRNMDEIIEKHGEVFDLMKQFYCQGRMYMMYGNHDLMKCRGLTLSCFPDIPVYESVFLKNERDHRGILLIHGHQGDLWNERLWYLTRFLVRYVWRPLEQLGIKDPTSAAKNYRKKDRVERRMAQWAKKNKQALIAGHTHRPYFSGEGSEGWYFNAGSGVHPHSVTSIEIVRGEISLVKWSELPDRNRYVRVEREVLEGPLPLSTLFDGFS